MKRNSSNDNIAHYFKNIQNIIRDVTAENETRLKENIALLEKNCSLRQHLGMKQYFESSKSLLTGQSKSPNPSFIDQAIKESIERFRADNRRLILENGRLKRENDRLESFCREKPKPANHSKFFGLSSRIAQKTKQLIHPQKKPLRL